VAPGLAGYLSTEEAMSETSFSTPQPPPREASRVPSPYGDEGRAGGAGRPRRLKGRHRLAV